MYKNERQDLLNAISHPVDIIVDYPLFLDNDDIQELEEREIIENERT